MRKIATSGSPCNILPATGNEFVINIKDTSIERYLCCRTLFFRKYRGNTNLSKYPDIYNIIAVIYFVLTFTNTYPTIYRAPNGHGDTYTTGANQMQTEDLIMTQAQLEIKHLKKNPMDKTKC